jgi:hypothetical protein
MDTGIPDKITISSAGIPDRITLDICLPIKVEWIELNFTLPSRRNIDSEWKQSKWEDDQSRISGSAR